MKQILHVDLLVANAERSLAFYVDALGCTVVEDAVVQIPSIAILTRGATDRVRLVLLRMPGTDATGVQPMIELMELQLSGGATVPVRFGSLDAPLPSLWSFSLLVYDIDAVIGELANAGIATATPVDVVPLPRLGTCRMAFVRDPDGNLIEIVDVPK
jgi:catechol 2,3-dioxygenase-like lactoylglutathione lyase family enzyme